MNLCGAIIDRRETDAVCLSMAKAGIEPLFGDARQDLKGFGVNRDVFLWDAEVELWKRPLPADSQAAGTCVSRGTYKAAQDSMYFSVVYSSRIMRTKNPPRLCFETIYGGSRVNVGRGRLGNSDGSIGAWAAQYCHDYGLIERGQYGTIDLTQPREQLSVTWGSPGHGVPRILMDESARYKAEACYQCESIEDIRDCIAAGYGVAFCSNTLWQHPYSSSENNRDSGGMCRPIDRGGHCEAVRGVCTDYKGRLVFVRQNSWGDSPRGGGPIKLRDGREVHLPEGCYGAFASDMATALKEGEAWAIAGPYSPFREAK